MRLQDLTEELHTNMEEKLTLQDKVGGQGLWVWSHCLCCCQVTVVMDQVMGLRQELQLSDSRYTLLQEEKQDEVGDWGSGYRRGRQGEKEREGGMDWKE